MTPPDIRLREITDDNREEVCALRVEADQEEFVASVEDSLDDAAEEPESNPWYRAVYSGDEPVGFVMLSWNAPVGHAGGTGRYFLWRFLIDARYQRRGIGAAVLARIIDLVLADGGTELFTSYEPGEGCPWPFYQRLGFQPTGEIDDGEIVLRLPLTGQ
jgi:diamine N-acetyltransferase